VVAAIDELRRHLAQIAIPSLPTRQLRMAAWALLLLQAGVFAYAFSRFQLGIIGLLDARRLRLSSLTGSSPFSQAFVLTILVLAGPYLYATYKLQGFDVASLRAGARQALAWVDPCKPDPAALALLQDAMDGELAAASDSAKRRSLEAVDEALGPLFADVDAGVEHYLDWYFTVIGEYQRLVAVASGDLGVMMGERLERYLFTETGFGERLADADRAIAEGVAGDMASLQRRLGERVGAGVETAPCALGGLDLSVFADLQRDAGRASLAAGGGMLVVVTSSKLLAKKAAATVVGKVAGKKSFGAAVALIGKASAKKGGSVLLSAAGGAALCSPGGPLAAVCGIVAGTAAWLAFDKAFVEIDEALFRQQMRDDILAVLAQQQDELALLLKARHDAGIDAMAARLRRSTDHLFIPARDGL